MVKSIARRFLDVVLVVAAVMGLVFVVQRDGTSSMNLTDVMVVVVGVGAVLACSNGARAIENTPAEVLPKGQHKAEMGSVNAE